LFFKIKTQIYKIYILVKKLNIFILKIYFLVENNFSFMNEINGHL